MKLNKKQILVTGLALLAMFFGAGNLIFPPMLGLKAGDDLFKALAGFIFTGVGLPLLGITAVAKAGGDLELLANRVHPLFSKIITTLVILSIGPLLAIPRTAATTFEVGIAPFLQSTDTQSINYALAVTTIIFFAITLYFVLKPSKIIDNIGKILTPLLILFLGIIIFKGIFFPLGSYGESQYTTPFCQGFMEGYNTMDALASVIFGLVIVNSIENKGVTDKNEIARVTILAGIIAAIGLSSIYTGLAYIGSTTGTTFTGDNPGQMLSYISAALLGNIGKISIATVMTLACLTTSIGLVASCGSFFNRLTKNKVSYNTASIITVLISTLLANMGLTKILQVSIPLLVNLYPVIIVLIFLSLLHDLFKGKQSVYIASICGTLLVTIINILYSVSKTIGLNSNIFKYVLSYLPLQDQGLGWIIPTVLLGILALIFSPLSKTK